MYIGLPVKYPLFLSDFNNFELSGRIFEKQISNFTKICPVGGELFRADRQTDGQT